MRPMAVRSRRGCRIGRLPSLLSAHVQTHVQAHLQLEHHIGDLTTQSTRSRDPRSLRLWIRMIVLCRRCQNGSLNAHGHLQLELHIGDPPTRSLEWHSAPSASARAKGVRPATIAVQRRDR
jgi:hypothetical protein